jgi:hypothetical protein
MESKAVRCGFLSLICGLSVYGIIKAIIDVFDCNPSSNLEIFGFTMLFAVIWSVMFIYPKMLIIGIPIILGSAAWLIFSAIGWEQFNSYYLNYQVSPYLKALFEYHTVQYTKELTIDFLIVSFILSIVLCFLITKLQSSVILWLITAPFMLICVYPQILDRFAVETPYSSVVGIYTHYSAFAFIVLIISDIALIAFNIYEKRNYPELYEKVKTFRRIIEILVILIVSIAALLIVLKYVLMAYILYNAIIIILYIVFAILFVSFL